MLNLDTHMLVFALNGELRPLERDLLAGDEWSISSIVLWELAKLIQLSRVDLNLDDPEVGRILSRIHIWPITLEVARVSTDLDFRSDPADEIIAATSLVHNIPLVTRDRVLQRSQIVPFALP